MKSSLAAIGAGLCAIAAPVSAAEMPTPVAAFEPPAALTFGGWQNDSTTVAHHRGRHGYRGYRGGYRGHRGGYRRNRTSVGDVIAGVAIIGGIAAIVNAATRKDRDRPVRYDSRYDDRTSRDASNRSGLDNAAALCIREIERDRRVERIDSIDRTAGGWRVAGSLYDGGGFTCTLGPNGRVDRIDYGSGFVNAADAVDRQYGDDRYAAAWRRQDGAPYETTVAGPQPAYPGGPLPGD